MNLGWISGVWKRKEPGTVIILCGAFWNILDKWDTATFAMEKLTRVLPVAQSIMTLDAKPYWFFYLIGAGMIVYQYSIKDPAGELWRQRRKLEEEEPERFVTAVGPTVNIDVNAGHVDVGMMVVNGTMEDVSLRVLGDRKMGFLPVSDASEPPVLATLLRPISDFTVASPLIRSGEVAMVTIRQHLPPALLAHLREELDDARVLLILLRWSEFEFAGEAFRFKMTVPDIVYHTTRAAAFTDRRN